MSVITDIEKQALDLPEQERAKLADRLIASLPPDFIYDDEIEEAERRSREIDEDPSKAITLEQLDEIIKDRRR
ncbi:MAG TPA: addiction module protein [Pyrinomonadaceae bacterium]|nr:addiction module protein [Pyrinomonadaceae bacterium]